MAAKWRLNTSKREISRFFFPPHKEIECILSGIPGALGILLGVEPFVAGVGITLVGAEGALKTIEERGTAVGFSDANEKEGMGKDVLARELPETAEEPEVAMVEGVPVEEAAGEVVEA